MPWKGGRKSRRRTYKSKLPCKYSRRVRSSAAKIREAKLIETKRVDLIDEIKRQMRERS